MDGFGCTVPGETDSSSFSPRGCRGFVLSGVGDVGLSCLSLCVCVCFFLPPAPAPPRLSSAPSSPLSLHHLHVIRPGLIRPTRVLRVINERLQGRYNLAVPRPAGLGAADAGNDLPLSVQGQVRPTLL